MNDTTLLQVTETAWIVKKGVDSVGILNKDVQDRYTLISGRNLTRFDDETQVQAHFQDRAIFDRMDLYIPSGPTRAYVKGFEVPSPEAVAIDDDDPRSHNDLPLYVKKEGSEVVFAAGFYAIKFPHAWVKSHNPKLSTLLEYGYQGPWETRQEMKDALRRLNAAKRAAE
jgi:hypothetical protein